MAWLECPRERECLEMQDEPDCQISDFWTLLQKRHSIYKERVNSICARVFISEELEVQPVETGRSEALEGPFHTDINMAIGARKPNSRYWLYLHSVYWVVVSVFDVPESCWLNWRDLTDKEDAIGLERVYHKLLEDPRIGPCRLFPKQNRHWIWQDSTSLLLKTEHTFLDDGYQNPNHLLVVLFTLVILSLLL